MFDPILHNPLINPIVNQTNYHNWIGGKSTPEGAILHWDADVDPFTEQTYNHHKFNYNVLSPQYQLNADGSYTNVGAKPAVDVFDGEKWLRSCGAVTNLLPSGSEDISGLAWTKRGTAQVAAFSDGANLVTGIESLDNDVFIYVSMSVSVPVTPAISIKKVSDSGVLLFLNPQSAHNGQWEIDLSLLGDGFEDIHSTHPAVTVVAPHVSVSDGRTGLHFRAKSGGPLSFYVRHPQLTATAYPVPYVPPGVTQPASNATTTNGSWFALPDGSELWHALDGGPDTDGVELVANGGFDTGIESWQSFTSNTTLEYSNGEAKSSRILSVTVDASLIGQSKTMPSGYRYKISFDAYSPTYRGTLRVDNKAVASGASPNATYVDKTLTDVKQRFTATLQADGTNEFRIIGGVKPVDVGDIVYFDNISIQRIQPQPLTLATRVRMGVGSGDIGAASEGIAIVSSKTSLLGSEQRSKTPNFIILCNDGSITAATATEWPRNSIIRRITQVNAAGTQFRVGYMIEGTHTAIQWGAWTAFDGSMNPSTLYRLMLGDNNAYPMWFSRITAWKEQVSDARILEALNG